MICKMKKLLVFLVSVLTMALLLTGCGGDTEKKDENSRFSTSLAGPTILTRR